MFFEDIVSKIKASSVDGSILLTSTYIKVTWTNICNNTPLANISEQGTNLDEWNQAIEHHEYLEEFE